MLNQLQLIEEKVLNLIKELNTLRQQSDELRVENDTLLSNSGDDNSKLESILDLLNTAESADNTALKQDRHDTEQ